MIVKLELTKAEAYALLIAACVAMESEIGVAAWYREALASVKEKLADLTVRKRAGA
jgi:hypothetical protein